MGKRVLAVGVAVVVIAGVAVVWAMSASSTPGYRTATAGPAAVTATLDTSGTIEAVTQSSLAFPTTGLVSAVDVAAGQQVTAGQTVAQLDTTSLAGQVASAQSTLATAQARLAADQSGEASSSSPAGRVATAAYVTSTSTPTDLKSQQDAVTSAQHQVDEDLTAASAAVSAQQKACQTVVDAKQPSDQNTVQACEDAIQAAQQAQATTGTDEQKLSDAETTLAATLAAQAANPPAPPTTTPTSPPSSTGRTPTSTTPSTGRSSGSTGSSSGSGGSTGKSSGSTGASGSRSSSGSSGSGKGSSPGSSGSSKAATTASPEQLAADQAAIDAANAEIAVAQQNLAAATLVSPITGTVGEVDFSAGKNTSTSQHIVVFGPGSNQVSTAVSDTQAGQIKPGQQVTVTPDGAGAALTGQVVSIGLLASTTSSGSPSYPVTVSVPSSTELHQGAAASVSIITSTANAAVTVPTSAVHLLGANAFVETLSGKQTKEQRVTLGVVGAAVTEINSGLTAGSQVVLADLSQPLPTSNTSNRGFAGGGGGGFAGGSGGGGGGARVRGGG